MKKKIVSLLLAVALCFGTCGVLAGCTKEKPDTPPESDTNILHLPDNRLASTSVIALHEGQRSASRTEITPKEDQSLEGATYSQNSLAYAEDVRNLNFRVH